MSDGSKKFDPIFVIYNANMEVNRWTESLQNFSSPFNN